MAEELPGWVEEGAGIATCNLLGKGSDYAAGVAVAAGVTGQLWPALGLATASAAFGALASAMGCTHNPGSPPGPDGITGQWCTDKAVATKITTGTFVREDFYGFSGIQATEYQRIGNQWYKAIQFTYYPSRQATVPVQTWYPEQSPGAGFHFEIVGGSCSGGGTAADQPSGDSYTYEHTDASTGCTYDYNFDGAYIDSHGLPQVQWKVFGKGAPTAFGQKNTGCSGGHITGYNWSIDKSNRYAFNPTFNVGGGPLGPNFRVDPATLAKLVYDILNSFDEGDIYRLTSVCEVDAGGEAIDKAIEVVIPPGLRTMGGQIDKRLDAIVKLLQGLKDFKQPICDPFRSKASGDLVSVRFVSLADSPGGTRRLKKLLRYSDQTLSDQCVHANHWEGFTWEAGPVVVSSRGLAWGVVQVWAKSADEGKRVIGHAAAVAGVDLNDPAHRWEVSHAKHPRYGQEGQMVVDRPELRSIWVTKRDGPSSLPEFPVAQ